VAPDPEGPARRPAGVRARAPIRLDLAGGWTDVPPFSAREGGAVVNLAINRYCYVTLRPRPAGVALVSADYGTRVEADAVGALRFDGTLDLLKAALVEGFAEHATRPESLRGPATHRPHPPAPPPHQGKGGAGSRGEVRRSEPAGPAGPAGLEVVTRSEAPAGSGTGGSGAMGVALVGAVAAYRGAALAPHEAALRAVRLERDHLRVAGGTQDQLAAAYGGANFMEFRDPAISVSPLRLLPPTVAELESRLVLCYTGVSRVSGDIIDAVMGAYEARTARTVAALRRLRGLAGDVKRILLAGPLDALGEALADNWRCQRDLHPSVSSASIEALCDRAAAAGALGGKALGAGGGGCLLFFAAPGREHGVARALAEAGADVLHFSLDGSGLLTWPVSGRAGVAGRAAGVGRPTRTPEPATRHRDPANPVPPKG
jgi:D-glycero-alpha-D-manno-heptose-7-phosphate kinase